jgi:hypothetical protein
MFKSPNITLSFTLSALALIGSISPHGGVLCNRFTHDGRKTIHQMILLSKTAQDKHECVQDPRRMLILKNRRVVEILPFCSTCGTYAKISKDGIAHCGLTTKNIDIFNNEFVAMPTTIVEINVVKRDEETSSNDLTAHDALRATAQALIAARL